MNEPELSILMTKSILFVDDEPHTRRAVERMLANRCNQIFLAENGQHGWDLLQSHRPDLVITDIEMPIMNGLELLEKIKAQNPVEPVVIMTAFEDEVHAAVRADAVLIKPVNRKLLFHTLVRVLARPA
ncbi:MAG: response regulator [Leptospiraceae bacterium]|nr:response regulator [Leptospiraceae bacterium]